MTGHAADEQQPEPAEFDQSTVDESAPGFMNKLRRRRLQLDLSDVTYDQLSRLMAESGAGSAAEFGRRAIQLYAFFLEHRRMGYQLVMAKDLKTFEVLEL